MNRLRSVRARVSSRSDFRGHQRARELRALDADQYRRSPKLSGHQSKDSGIARTSLHWTGRIEQDLQHLNTNQQRERWHSTLRLCRLMFGKALPFRNESFPSEEAMPPMFGSI